MKILTGIVRTMMNHEDHTTIKLKAILLMVLICFIFQATSQQGSRVIHVSKMGNDRNPGTQKEPLLTIQKGAKMAKPGDSVIVHEGIYRERLSPPMGGLGEDKRIVFKAASGESVIIKGSELWNPDWKPHPQVNHVFGARPDDQMFNDDVYITDKNPFKVSLAHAHKILPSKKGPQTLGQVFVNGKRFDERFRPAVFSTPGTWYFDPDTEMIYVNFGTDRPPDDQIIEITTRRAVIKPHRTGLGYITIDGFVIEHCGNQQIAFRSEIPGAMHGQVNGAIDVHHGHHWIIENNTVRYAKSIGINIGGSAPRSNERNVGSINYLSSHHIVRNNTVTDNGTLGIGAFMPKRGTGFNVEMWGEGVVIDQNIVEGNNYLWFDDVVNAGIKTTNFVGGVISNNLVANNNAIGIWIDGRWPGARITSNKVIGNYIFGIFVEFGNYKSMSDSGLVPNEELCIVDNNIVLRTEAFPEGKKSRTGSGIKLNSASGVIVANNLVAKNRANGIFLQYSDRRRGGVIHNSHNYIIRNIIAKNRTNIKPCENVRFCINNVFEFNLLDKTSDIGENLVFNELMLAIDMKNDILSFSLPLSIIRTDSPTSDQLIRQGLMPKYNLPQRMIGPFEDLNQGTNTIRIRGE